MKWIQMILLQNWMIPFWHRHKDPNTKIPHRDISKGKNIPKHMSQIHIFTSSFGADVPLKHFAKVFIPVQKNFQTKFCYILWTIFQNCRDDFNTWTKSQMFYIYPLCDFVALVPQTWMLLQSLLRPLSPPIFGLDKWMLNLTSEGIMHIPLVFDTGSGSRFTRSLPSRACRE